MLKCVRASLLTFHLCFPFPAVERCLKHYNLANLLGRFTKVLVLVACNTTCLHVSALPLEIVGEPSWENLGGDNCWWAALGVYLLGENALELLMGRFWKGKDLQGTCKEYSNIHALG